MNVVAFFDILLSNFGSSSGEYANVFPEGQVERFVYATILLILCTIICAVGSSIFSKAGNILFVILLLSIFSIPLSLWFVAPYSDAQYNAPYTGPSWSTIQENLMPHFTSGAAGSDRTGKETFQNMFSIFFPATAGIFAGAGMSGDLRAPSKSIPNGTLWSLLVTFVLYLLVILSVGGSVSRELLHQDIQIVQNINISSYVIMIGELSTSLYSSLVGTIGAAKLLQAIARDNLLPVLGVFSQGTSKADNPLAALALTFLLTEVTVLLDVNQIAMFITMAFLMTFVATNVACFLLKVSSAPNFRPSFKYFSHWTAGMGALACLGSMFISDGPSASGMIILLTFLFLVIHYISPPKPWGDVSQSLIYHQVRKYLLRLKQDHVKYWRPQILVLVDDPKRSWNLIHFCNHLKKGGLYILGHVVITKDFHNSYPEVTKQQEAWAKLRDMGHVKGFVQIAASSDVVWGARNVYLGSGLGGMKPNITVIGLIKSNRNSADSSSSAYGDALALNMEPLPTDGCRKEPSVTTSEWVNIIEDLITMHANIAVAKGFNRLQFPEDRSYGGFIDLYPIQMSAQITTADNNDDNDQAANPPHPSSSSTTNKSILTTNFDTYTLILQLGAILQTVPAWKKTHELRVMAFVETSHQVKKEQARISTLLTKLRIKAQVRILCLTDFDAYNVVVLGKEDKTDGQRITAMLQDDSWWKDLQAARSQWSSENLPDEVLANLSQVDSTILSSKDWNSVMDRRQRWYASAKLHNLGVNLNMHTNRLSTNELSGVASGRPSPTTSTRPSRAPSRTASDDGERTPLLRRQQSSSSSASASPAYTPATPTSGSRQGPKLSFNDVPAHVQHIILNDMMKSTSKDAAVIFSTLPAPTFGTHESEEDSEAYVESLEKWCQGLPPVMLLHSQSMTVTTAL